MRQPRHRHVALDDIALESLALRTLERPQIIARFAGLDFGKRRANALAVDNWRSLYDSCHEGANKLQRDLEQFLASELARLEQEWPRDLPRAGPP